jgi:hypothetical protein
MISSKDLLKIPKGLGYTPQASEGRNSPWTPSKKRTPLP